MNTHDFSYVALRRHSSKHKTSSAPLRSHEEVSLCFSQRIVMRDHVLVRVSSASHSHKTITRRDKHHNDVIISAADYKRLLYTAIKGRPFFKAIELKGIICHHLLASVEHKWNRIKWILQQKNYICCYFTHPQVFLFLLFRETVMFFFSGGPLSALTCCVNARLLSAIKKISPLIYSQSWVGSWVYTTQAMMTFTLIF